MSRNKDVTDEQRADFQRRVALLVHALLDTPMFNRVEVEHTQHADTYYALVRLPNNSGFSNNSLQSITKIASDHKATITIGDDGSLMFWIQGVEGEE